MKKLIQFSLLICSLNLFSQSTIKFVDFTSKKPAKDILAHIINDNDVLENTGITDKNGYFYLKVLKFDKTKNYYYYIDQANYIKVKEKIDWEIKDTITVELKANPNYRAKNFPKETLVMNCPYFDFGGYVSKEPRSLSELPIAISTKVKSYLLSRVGKKFYKNIYFKQGQIIDSIPYKKYFENAKMETRYYYFLCFAYTNLEKGIGEYTSNVELDEFGNIIKDIDFPKKSSTSNKFISLEEIKKKAVEKNFFIKDKTNVELDYDTVNNILVWKFINEEHKENGIFLQSELTYNAHNGNFLDLKVNKGEWVE
ncbi:hypothetical protein WMW71_10820 [Flavobacterium buctense]|uniref:Carboxypeptidase regulatory-like domain-containing protein n=1 Tax=Flavobacterium buctense TaxID=1648146 RepID=A0ABU9E2P7_9FLAO|nr:hypothetical protein [Flavobacterium buctense]